MSTTMLIGMALNAVIVYLFRKIVAWDRVVSWFVVAGFVAVPYLVFGFWFLYRVGPLVFRFFAADPYDEDWY